MRKLAMSASIACMASVVAGGVYDDVSYWFRGCYNGNSDVDTRLNNYEFPNALTIGTAQHPSGDNFSIVGSRVNLQVETMDVIQPFVQRKLLNRQVLHFVQPDAITDGVVEHKATALTLSGPFQFKKNESFSVSMRFKCDSLISGSGTWCSLFQSDYSWSGNCGFRVILEDAGNGFFKIQIWLGSSQKKTYDKVLLPYGKWIDLMVTVKGALETGDRSNTTVYACVEDGVLQSQQINIYYATEKDFYNHSVMWIGGYNSDSVTNYFRGWLQQLGIWRRCLASQEVEEAFADNLNAADVWRLGVANDSVNDFSGTNYVDKVRPEKSDCFSQTDYRHVPKSLNADRTKCVLSFSLDAASALRNRTFSIKTTSASAKGRVSVRMNGYGAGTVDLAAGAAYNIEIPANFFVTGDNLLEVGRMESDEGDIELDQLALFEDLSFAYDRKKVEDDVFADAYCWFRGAIDRDGNGYLGVPTAEKTSVTYEFPDVFSLARPMNEANAMFIRGVWSNVLVSAQNVVVPARGITLENEKCVYFTQWTGKNDKGENLAMGGGLQKSLFPVTNAASYSVVVRFKMDSYSSAERQEAEIFGFGYMYSNRAGVGVKLKGDPENMHVQTFFGGAGIDFKGTQSAVAANRLSAGKWIDMALVVSNGYARLCTYCEGGEFVSQSPVKLSSSSLGFDSDATSLHVGTWSGAFDMEPSGSGSLSKFRGWIHQVAVWPRALTDTEVEDSFAWPSPDLVRMGVADGTSGELAGGSVFSWTATAGGDTKDAPSAIPGNGGSLRIAFDVPENEVRYAQLMKISLSKETADGAIVEVLVNGTPVVNYDEAYNPVREFAISAGGACEVGIPRNTLKSGTNLIAISRVDRSLLPVMLDAVSIGRHGRTVTVRKSGYVITVR